MQGFKVFFSAFAPSVARNPIFFVMCAGSHTRVFSSISGQYNCPLLYRLCAHIHVRISHPASLVWLGHRQISPSLSYLHDMTFLACGACGILSCIRSSLADRQYRPARSAPPALDVPSVCAIRNATHLRQFPEILS